jgi:arsenate reductase (glutaredoxin)
MYTIYHNPRCSKSRAGLAHLEENNCTFEVVKYLDEGLSKDLLKDLMEKLGAGAEDLIRKHEDLYKKELKGKSFTEDEWLDIIIENPRLLMRPIIVKDEKAVWAVPAEEISKL